MFKQIRFTYASKKTRHRCVVTVLGTCLCLKYLAPMAEGYITQFLFMLANQRLAKSRGFVDIRIVSPLNLVQNMLQNKVKQAKTNNTQSCHLNSQKAMTNYFLFLLKKKQTFPVSCVYYSVTLGAVGQAVACAPVTQRARIRSPVGTSFLGEVFSGFFLTYKTNVRSFRPPRSPNIIWPSLSPIFTHYGRQRPEMLMRPKTSNIQILIIYIIILIINYYYYYYYILLTDWEELNGKYNGHPWNAWGFFYLLYMDKVGLFCDRPVIQAQTLKKTQEFRYLPLASQLVSFFSLILYCTAGV